MSMPTRRSKRPLSNDRTATSWPGDSARSASTVHRARGRWAAGAAGAFTDTAGYASRVLDGAGALPARVGPAVGFTTSSAVADAVGLLGAVALTPVLLRGARQAVQRWHRSSPGDAVAWITVGAAAFATGLAVALR